MYFTTEEFIEHINENCQEELNYIYQHINEKDFINHINKRFVYIYNNINGHLYEIANELFDKKYLNRKVKQYLITTDDSDFIKLYNRLCFLNSLEGTTPKTLFEFKVDNLDTFNNFLNKTKRRG